MENEEAETATANSNTPEQDALLNKASQVDQEAAAAVDFDESDQVDQETEPGDQIDYKQQARQTVKFLEKVFGFFLKGFKYNEEVYERAEEELAPSLEQGGVITNNPATRFIDRNGKRIGGLFFLFSLIMESLEGIKQAQAAQGNQDNQEAGQEGENNQAEGQEAQPESDQAAPGGGFSIG